MHESHKFKEEKRKVDDNDYDNTWKVRGDDTKSF